MTTIDVERITAAIEARMASGEPFTFKSLWLPHGDVAYRIADRLIQKWRKTGRISFSREGQQAVWRLVDKPEPSHDR